MADHSILQRANLQLSDLTSVVSRALAGGADYADLFFEQSQSEWVAVDDGKVRTAQRSSGQGIGVRAIAGERQGYAHTDVLTVPSLLQAADACGAIATGHGKRTTIAVSAGGQPVNRYPIARPPMALPLDVKVSALAELDAMCRAADPRVHQVTAQISVSEQIVCVVRGDGSAVWDTRPLVRLDCSVIAKGADGRLARGSFRGGGRMELQPLLTPAALRATGQEAVRQALVNLQAIEVPAGVMDVVLGPGWPAVLLHEAIGHGLEGDFNRKGTSAFAGKMGQQVASELCTVVDDGTRIGDRGALNVDDEGTPGQNTTLIQDGKLVGYMHDLLGAHLMGVSPTGNGRRESYAHLPMPRMRNTYLLPGQDDPEEIVRGVNKGIMAVDFGGGQVDITSGKFVFEMTEAYLIEDGKIGAPLKGATLIGNGPDVLTRVSAVGHDLGFQKAQGVCGKEGQSVPVGVGQPTLRIDQMTIGGSQVA
ncbi:MAG: metalloprotease TldD [Myxococcales bacterium]|nr:metalloprotease TldD [Myxococcales bacterium]